MKCNKVEDLLVLYTEDKLEPGLKKTVEEHIRACKNCSGLLEKLTSTANQLRNLETKKLPGDFYSGLQAKLAREQASRQSWLFSPRVFIPSMSIAAAMLVFVFGLDYFSSGKNDISNPMRTIHKPVIQHQARKTEIKKTIELAKFTNKDIQPAIFRGTGAEFKTKKIVKQWQDTYSGITTKKSLIINNPDEWQKLWKTHTKNMKPAPALPAVDFNSNTVIAVFMGEKKSEGYGIHISGIKESENTIYIELEETVPAQNAAAKPHPTQPYHIVVINKK